MYDIKVYEVRYYLSSPIDMSSPIHLDAILSAVHPAMHNLSAKPERFNSDSSEIIDAPLPICSFISKGNWVWACTAGEFPDSAIISADSITKRRGPQDQFNFQRQYLPASGCMKDRFITFQEVITPYIYFLAATIRERELTRIAKRVNSIGGKRKSGWGMVSKLEISEVEVPLSEILVKDGIARRRIPEEFLEGEATNILQCKSPYWHPARVEPGCEVGDPVKLADSVKIRYERGEEYAIF